MSFSINDLSMGEIAQIEELTGQSISQLGDDSQPKAKFMTALAWMSKRREDPSFTFGQAEALNLAEVSEIISGQKDADPKVAAKS